MSLLSWYPLNGTLEDRGLNMIKGTQLGNLPVEDSGKIGRTFTFKNDDNGVSIDGLNYVGLTKYTMCAWIKPLGNHRNYNGAIISSGNWNSKSWTFGVSQTNNAIDVAGASYNKYINYNIPVGKWTHILCTGENNSVKVYVNGEYIGTKSATTTLVSDYSNTTIGRETYFNGYFAFNGNINDVRIYDNVVSEAEIAEIYASCVLHYDFSDPYIQKTTNRFRTLSNNDLGFNLSRWEIATTYPELPFDKISQVYKRINTNTYYGSATDYFNSTEIATPDFFINQEYWASLWYYRSNSSSVQVSFAVYGNNGTSDYASFANVQYYGDRTVVGKWTYLKAKITLLPGAVKLTYLSGSSGGDIANNLYITNWQFEYGEGATPYTPNTRSENIIYDNSGYNHDGVVAGNIVSVENAMGHTRAIKINGIETVTTDKIFYDNKYQCWSISTWIYRTSDADQQLFNNFNNGNSIMYSTTKKTLLYCNGGQYDHYVYGSTLPINTWTHIVWVYDWENNICKVYYNGQLNATSGNFNNTIDLTASGFSSTTVFFNNLRGMVSDTKIYATVLKDEYIKKLYECGAKIANNGNFFSNELVEHEYEQKELLYGMMVNDYTGSAIGSASTAVLENNYLNIYGMKWLGSDYLPVDINKKYQYDICLDNEYGLIYVGWERYNIDKATGINSSTWYIYSSTEVFANKTLKANINPSDLALKIEGKDVAFLRLRILTQWTGTNPVDNTKKVSIKYISLHEAGEGINKVSYNCSQSGIFMEKTDYTVDYQNRMSSSEFIEF